MRLWREGQGEEQREGQGEEQREGWMEGQEGDSWKTHEEGLLV